MSDAELLQLTFEDAERLWAEFAPDRDDLLARAAFDRTLRWALGLEDEGLYFRPGGWTVDLPATVARVACSAAILAASFHLAGLEDLDSEILIATAGLVSTMNLRPVRLTGRERLLLERLRDEGMTDIPLAPKRARKALPRRARDQVTREDVEDALEHLVQAGVADREGDSDYVIRGAGDDAWIRVSLG
jgi:hypothetical protein